MKAWSAVLVTGLFALVGLAQPLSAAPVLFSVDSVETLAIQNHDDSGNLTSVDFGCINSFVDPSSTLRVYDAKDPSIDTTFYEQAFLVTFNLAKDNDEWVAGSAQLTIRDLNGDAVVAQFQPVVTYTGSTLTITGDLITPTGANSLLVANNGAGWQFVGDDGQISRDNTSEYNKGKIKITVTGLYASSLDELLSRSNLDAYGAAEGRVVPEPATVAILLAGAAFLRRARRAA